MTPALRQNKKAAGLAGDGGHGIEQTSLYPRLANPSRPAGGILELTAAVDAVEYATVSAILASHPAGVAQAEQAGLTPAMIQAPDLRLIHEACVEARTAETWGYCVWDASMGDLEVGGIDTFSFDQDGITRVHSVTAQRTMSW